MKDQVKEIFNQLAGVYENNVDTTSLYNSEYERPAMINNLPKNMKAWKVLDAGCAAGWYTLELLKRGASVEALDISPEMVNATKRRVGSKAKVQCLDLEKVLPFENNSFDLILSSLTLHYLKDWDHTFKEFQRIVKPKGCFMFSVHHPFTDIGLLEEPNYFETELIVDTWIKEGKEYCVPFYRRSLQELLNTTLKYFYIEEVIEPQPTDNFKIQSPEAYERLMKSPQFLIIKASHGCYKE